MAGRRPYETMTPIEARAAYAASREVMQAPAAEVGAIRDISVTAQHGELRLRTYRGRNTQPGERLPCLLFLHGGGWVFGNLESHDRLCRSLANTARCCVVAVDYRLAPEHRFPAALDDAA